MRRSRAGISGSITVHIWSVRLDGWQLATSSHAGRPDRSEWFDRFDDSSLHRSGVPDAETVAARLRLLASLDVARAPITAEMLNAAWSMRENVAARDALYVSLARTLGARLVTTDQRLARAFPDLAI